MGLLYAILLGAGGMIAIVFFLLVSWAIYYDLSRSNIPASFDHPFKLRFIYRILILMFTMGKILEVLGLCRQVVLVRFLLELWRPAMDPSLSSKDLHFDGVPVRVYQHKAPSAGQRRGLVFFHGGAGIVGSISMYEDVCSKIAKESDSVLVSVGYRLAPEHPYPAQWKDCFTATVHFMQNAELYGVDPSQIVIAGDSAGGNYASVVAQNLVERSDLPKLRAQVLIYGTFQSIDFNLPSYQQNSRMPLLFRENLLYYCLKYFLKDTSLSHDLLKGSHVPDEMRLKYGKWMNPDNIPEKFKRRGYERVPLAPYKPDVYKQVAELHQLTFSSLFAGDAVIRELPETLIVSCEYDVFRDDSLLYKKRLEDNGVKFRWFHAENGFHGILNLFSAGFLTFPNSIEILDNIVDFVKHL
ncbi:arylacetamide deacetylase-like 4 [Elgaria multicarinata webbii]|uniref:arylacetamide deacetylase-like 4 n=1 Tax=Elgaria multicarinata webbii TaxID=159646 RepID=UPI002FCD1531